MRFVYLTKVKHTEIHMGLFSRKKSDSYVEDNVKGSTSRGWNIEESYTEWDGSEVSTRTTFTGRTSNGLAWTIDCVTVDQNLQMDVVDDAHISKHRANFYTRWHTANSCIEHGYVFIRPGDAKSAKSQVNRNGKFRDDSPHSRLIISEIKKVFSVSYPEAKRTLSFLELMLLSGGDFPDGYVVYATDHSLLKNLFQQEVKTILKKFAGQYVSIGLSEEKLSIMISGENLSSRFVLLERMVSLGEAILHSEK